MYNIHRTVVFGNSTGDAKIGLNKSGKEYVIFDIATNERWKDQSGERQEKTTYTTVFCKGSAAIAGGKLVKKGDIVHATGKIEANINEFKGEKRARLELHAFEIIVISRNRQAPSSEYDTSFNTEEFENEPEEPKEFNTESKADEWGY